MDSSNLTMSALSILSVSVFKNCIAMDMLLFILHPTGNCEISRKQEISLFQTGRIDCKLTFLKKKLPVFKLTWKEKSKQIYLDWTRKEYCNHCPKRAQACQWRTAPHI